MLRNATHALMALLVATLTLTACETNNRGADQTTGSVDGTAAGGPSGSQSHKGTGNLATASASVILDGWAGSEFGTSMDETDKLKNAQAEKRAYTAPIGQKITWNNPSNGSSGTIIPTRDGYAANGAYCREFQQTITIGGRQQQGYGKACQQPNGSWKIVQG